MGVEKQAQMTAVRQNILSTIMLKNVKLSCENVRYMPGQQLIEQASYVYFKYFLIAFKISGITI